ncbi:MAG: class I SAM-dependent RNA methyltransferase [Firmicutes bacterium]|nr:class I SAM-dependent RNA methyltransferase [Bacillota bacterium]
MSKLELIATATFGLESVVKREIENLGYKVTKSEDAKITYMTDERGIVRSNLWLRCADRVLLKMGEFMAESSEELFQQTKAIPWEQWIPEDGKFTVTCTTVKSKLRSEPACQKTVKKAIVERMGECYMREQFPETGASYTVKVTLLKDRATLTIDTSGSGLHTRGYRKNPVRAPIKETLAAALVQLSYWKTGRLLVDPFCGSGTIPIEAAMICRNIAPGLGRTFASAEWDCIAPEIWKEERTRAYAGIDYDADVRILASDIDRKAVEAARLNAEEAGVDDCIDFSVRDFLSMEKMPEPYTILISNPPYGQRVGDRKILQAVNGHFRELLAADESLSCYVITADRTLEKAIGRKADRRRKLYNGNLETCYYQYYGRRPPKKENEGNVSSVR